MKNLSGWQNWISILLPVVAVAVAAVAINLYALKHPWRLDMTSTGVYSIGPQSKRVIGSVKQPVEIVFFYDARSKAMNDSRLLLEQYASASEHISVRAVDPQLQPAEARRYNIRFPGSSVFRSNGRTVVINGGTEADFTNGLIRITNQSEQQICFTEGHVESDPFSLRSHDHFEGDMTSDHNHSSGGRSLEIHERHGMGIAKDALETLGYRVKKVILASRQHTIDDCAVVVVASPQQPFTSEELTRFRDYLLADGKAIVMLEPFVRHGLDGILREFGIAVAEGYVTDEKNHYWTDPATPAVSTYVRHKITRDLALTYFPGAVALTPVPGARPKGLLIRPLIHTSERSLINASSGTDATRTARERKTLMVEASKLLPTDAGGKKANKKWSRLVVFGDGDFATNTNYSVLGNGALFLNAVNVLAGEDRLVNIEPRKYRFPAIRLTNRQMMLTFAISAALLPALLLVAGSLVWWRRR